MGMGKRQKAVLALFRARGGEWYPGIGWVWGTDSETDRILHSLYRRGYVSRTGTTPSGYGSYTTLTEIDQAEMAASGAESGSETGTPRAGQAGGSNPHKLGREDVTDTRDVAV